jgi:hypothetical protein
LLKTSVGEIAGQVHPAGPLRQSLVGWADRFPRRDRQPAAIGQDPAALAQGCQRRVAELNGINAHDRVDTPITQPQGGEVGHAEPGVIARLAARGDSDRHRGAIQAYQARAGPAGNLAAITSAAAGQVDENLPWSQP